MTPQLPDEPTPSASPRDERGASAVEYGLLVAGIAALVVVGIFALGGIVVGLFDDSCQSLKTSIQRAQCTP